MKEALKILLVEDNPNDERILTIELKGEFNATVERVETETEFRSELNDDSYAIIISDYNLPTFTGMQALKIRQELAPMLPFILVTGSLNEEIAVAVMKAGADDYVLKENLSRLVPAVKSAIEKRKAMREKAEAEKKLIEAEIRFRSIFENTVIGLYRTSPDGEILLANPALIKMLGFSSFEELTKRNLALEGFEPENHRNVFLTEIEKKGSVSGIEAIWKKADGTLLYVRESGIAVRDDGGKTIFYEGVVEDVTEKKEIEAELVKSEFLLSTTLDSMVEGCQIINFDWRYIYTNDSAAKHGRKTKDQIIGKTITEVYPGIENTEMFSLLQKCMAEKTSGYMENKLTFMDGTCGWFELSIQAIPDGLFILSHEITKRKKAESALKESEEKYRLITENTADLITVSDLNFKSIYVSPSILQVRGFTVEEAMTQKLSEILTPESLQKVMSTFAVEMAKELAGDHDPSRSVLIEVEEYHKNGSIIPVELKSNFIRDEYNNPVSILTVTRDITERKKYIEMIKQSEEQFHATWENSFDGMQLTDQNGTFVEVNSSFCKLVNKNREELIGQKFTTIYREKQHDIFDRYLNNFNNKSFHPQLEAEVLLWDGQRKWFSLSNSLIETGQNKKLMLSIFHDITERKEYEKELIAALDKAEEMNRVKSYFFANMSHELRTPFVGIMGFADLLHSSLTDPDDKELAKGILNASHRIMDTLTKILSISKLESDKYAASFTDIDITDLTKKIYNQFSAAAKNKNLRFNMTCNFDSIVIKSDENLLLDILNNLINNAIIYTKYGGVSISVDKLSNEAKNFIKIEVADSGIGIPKDKHEIIFEAFRQASEGTTRDFQGTGLGLAIVKKSVELLGGRITLISDVGSGSIFSVELPIE